jgi:hypothetical protein
MPKSVSQCGFSQLCIYYVYNSKPNSFPTCQSKLPSRLLRSQMIYCWLYRGNLFQWTSRCRFLKTPLEEILTTQMRGIPLPRVETQMSGSSQIHCPENWHHPMFVCGSVQMIYRNNDFRTWQNGFGEPESVRGRRVLRIVLGDCNRKVSCREWHRENGTANWKALHLGLLRKWYYDHIPRFFVQAGHLAFFRSIVASSRDMRNIYCERFIKLVQHPISVGQFHASFTCNLAFDYLIYPFGHETIVLTSDILFISIAAWIVCLGPAQSKLDRPRPAEIERVDRRCRD